eukprot:570260-Hanusia_phi.AAC.1
MVSLPNVLCIDSGLETPYAHGAELYRGRREDVEEGGGTDDGSGSEWLPLKISLQFDAEEGRFR